MALWIIAGMTFREAARKKILWTAVIAGLGFLGVFGIGLHYQMADSIAGSMPPFLRYQILSGMLMIGLYTVDLLAVVMTILTSMDTISGEIDSGTIHAIATKPIARWQVLIGKWMGFVGMLAIYVALMFGGTIAEAHWIGGVSPQNPIAGALLVFLECVLALTVTFMFGTWFSTLTNGVIVLGLHGLAFSPGGRRNRLQPRDAHRGRVAAGGFRNGVAPGGLASLFTLRRYLRAESRHDRLCRRLPVGRAGHRHLSLSEPRPLSWSISAGQRCLERHSPGWRPANR
jgi:hypothetical protein